jgi:hypothetical protein
MGLSSITVRGDQQEIAESVQPTVIFFGPPFLNQVNHADVTVTPSAIDEITMGIQPFIQFILAQAGYQHSTSLR